MMSLEQLPIRRAILHFINSVSFSNPLPHWHDYRDIKYDLLVSILLERMNLYFKGETTPNNVYNIDIPDVSEKVRKWVVPSVHDQMILETLVMEMAQDISPAEQSPSYSFRYSSDQNQLGYYEDNFSAWERFQIDSFTKAEQAGGYLVVIDLKEAFSNFDRDRLFDFILRRSRNKAAGNLFKLLIQAFEQDGTGLPNINDSTFFVGNAYLSNADKLVAKITDNFIRYMDNYHLFAASEAKAMELIKDVADIFTATEFQINDSKTQIIKLENYFWGVSDIPGGEHTQLHYLSAPIGGKMDAVTLYSYVHLAISSPDSYMTKSFGRLVLGSLRKARMTADENYQDYLNYLLVEKPLDNQRNSLLPSALILLEEYWYQGRAQEWRVLWLLYILFDFRTKAEVKQKLTDLATIDEGDKLISAKLWIKRLYSPMIFRKASDLIHQQNYLEEGRILYGE